MAAGYGQTFNRNFLEKQIRHSSQLMTAMTDPYFYFISEGRPFQDSGAQLS